MEKIKDIDTQIMHLKAKRNKLINGAKSKIKPGETFPAYAVEFNDGFTKRVKSWHINPDEATRMAGGEENVRVNKYPAVKLINGKAHVLGVSLPSQLLD